MENLRYRIEIQHKLPETVFETVGAVQDLLLRNGFVKDSVGNLIGLFSEEEIVDNLQGVDADKTAILSDVDVGLVRHDSTASGGNHPEYNSWIGVQFQDIFDLNQ